MQYGSPDSKRLLSEAESLIHQAVEMNQRLAAPNLKLASSMNTLGDIYFEQGKFFESEQIYRNILAMQLDPKKNLNGYYGLASALREQGNFPEALAMHRKELELRRKVNGEGSPHLIWPLNQYGLTLKSSGDPKGAEAAWLESLAIEHRYYPETHHDFWARDRLIELYRSQGRSTEADALLNEIHEAAVPATAPAELVLRQTLIFG